MSISQALDAYRVTDNQVFEIRMLNSLQFSGRDNRGTVMGYFDNIADATSHLKKNEWRQASGTYITVNPLPEALLSRRANRLDVSSKTPSTSDKDIKRLAWLVIDVDAVHESGISSTDEEKRHSFDVSACVKAALKCIGFYDPIETDSSNGSHLLYRIDLPSSDSELVRAVLVALGNRFSNEFAIVDQTLYSPGQIIKLPGTMSRKGDSTATRPHRMAQLLAVPNPIRVNPRQLLEQVAAWVVPTRAEPTPQASEFDLKAWVARFLPDAKGPEKWSGGPRRWSLPVCPWNSEHTNGSAFVGELSNGKLTAGCHHNGCTGKDWHSLRAIFDPKTEKTHAAPAPAPSKFQDLDNPQERLEFVALRYVVETEDAGSNSSDILGAPRTSWSSENSLCVVESLRALLDASEPISILTVKDWLISRGHVDQWKLLQQTRINGTAGEFRQAMDRILEFGRKRTLSTILYRAQGLLKDPDVSAEETERKIILELSSTGDMPSKRASALSPVSYTEMMQDLAKQMRDRASCKANDILTTPFPEFDRLVSINKGNLIIVASRPKMGKSAFAGQVGRHIAAFHGPVLKVSLEMTTDELAERFLCQSTKKNKLNLRESDALREAAENLPFYFYDQGASLKLTIKRFRRFLSEHPNAKLIIVDQLGLVVPERAMGGKWEGNRAQEIGTITQTLKTFASQFKIPILALHQLRRQADPKKPPTMDDLKDSGKVEEDANVIALLWRKSLEDTVAQIEIVQRSGSAGTFYLNWRGNYVSYRTKKMNNADPESDSEDDVNEQLGLISDDQFPF